MISETLTEENATLASLERQVECYRRLLKLAELQHQHVQQDDTNALLEVLKARKVLLEEIRQIEIEISPVKRSWSQFIGSVTKAELARIEPLLAETRTLLQQINTADRDDVLVLQQRKLNLGRQIQQASAAKQLNRNYGAAAYGASESDVDVQS